MADGCLRKAGVGFGKGWDYIMKVSFIIFNSLKNKAKFIQL